MNLSMSKLKATLIFPVFISLLLFNCSSHNPSSPTRPFKIEFVAEANNQSLICGSNILGLGITGADVLLEDFRFYLHDVIFITSTGEEIVPTLDDNAWQTQNIVLIDFQNKSDKCTGIDKAVHKKITGNYQNPNNATIVGLKFKVGIPEKLNHINPVSAVTPLNILGLQWNWQMGYKFMRLDVSPVGGVTRSGDPVYTGSSWNIHLGSTGCTGNPEIGESVNCTRINRPKVSLSDFTVNQSQVLIDYGKLVSQSILAVDEGGAPGCQSSAIDPECISVFKLLGLKVESGDSDVVNEQVVFSLQ